MRNFLDEWGLLVGSVLMVILSGIAAYIHKFEKSDIDWPARKHFITVFSALIFSGFSGMLVWYGAQSAIGYGLKIPEPLIPFLIGIAGFSGAKFVEFVGVTFLDWGRKKLGLEPKEQK